MNERDLVEHLDNSLGQAIFGGMSQAALWLLLVSKGVLSRDEAERAIDGVLLVMERARGEVVGAGCGPGAIDAALSHLEALLASLKKLAG